MKRRSLLFLAVVMVAHGAHATLMEEKRVLDIVVSDQGLTRISVQDSKIQDVFLHPSDVSQNIQLHKSGHVFLTPDGLQGPVFLTLITDRDQTQDLKIRFQRGRKNAPIILTKTPKKKTFQKPESMTQEGVLILKKFVEGKLPQGFVPVIAQGDVRQGQGVRFKEVRRFQKGPFKVSAFQGKNKSEKGIELQEKVFARHQDVALAFEKKAMGPQERTVLWVLRRDEK